MPNEWEKEFKVYTDGWNGPDSPASIFARDEQSAVERYTEINHGNWDYPSEVEVHVIHDDGTKCGYRVTVESCPVFHATRL